MGNRTFQREFSRLLKELLTQMEPANSNLSIRKLTVLFQNSESESAGQSCALSQRPILSVDWNHVRTLRNRVERGIGVQFF